MSKDTYTRILDVARRLFVTQGYAGTSMRQLAGAAGIGNATVYHHFGDKESIAHTLIERELGPPPGPARRKETDPIQEVESIVRESLAVFLRSADLVQVLQREVPACRSLLDASFKGFWESHTLQLADALNTGIEQGLVRPIDASQAAQTLTMMVFGLVSTAAALKTLPPTPKEGSKMLLDIFWNGVAS